ncbi:response regulator transcription factor [Candidatus Phytoplasma meliae]|uniref:Response regulator transcription factor n=1 Tax=Candidatus Phytoplasma meliae TaxID=1848402 RepID=A0ABS5CXZ1_9MOLU|nr:sigma-70 family RNA polymerase sigma factor [Candidatus Phytoplasma meliae]MBP5835843.1 response regulator transcription factor [Candidatus Phytoplasma meliae]
MNTILTKINQIYQLIISLLKKPFLTANDKKELSTLQEQETELIQHFEKNEILELSKEMKKSQENYDFQKLQKLQQRALKIYFNDRDNQFLKDAIIFSYEPIYKEILKSFRYQPRFVTYQDKLQDCYLFATEALNKYDEQLPNKLPFSIFMDYHVENRLKNKQKLDIGIKDDKKFDIKALPRMENFNQESKETENEELMEPITETLMVERVNPFKTPEQHYNNQTKHEQIIELINEILTPKEKEVAMLAFGFNLNNENDKREFSYEYMVPTLKNQQIAEKLKISKKTVENHKSNIIKKLKEKFDGHPLLPKKYEIKPKQTDKQLIKETRYRFDFDDDKCYSVFEYKLKNGEIIKESKYPPNDKIHCMIEYNPKTEKPIKETYYDSDGKELFEKKYKKNQK